MKYEHNSNPLSHYWNPHPDDPVLGLCDCGAELNASGSTVIPLGPKWDTDQLRAEFEVLGFQAPFVVVRRKADGVKGSLQFTHAPRVYFGWQEDK